MIAIRRWAAAAVLLLSAVGLAACRKQPVEIPDVPTPVPSRLDGTLYFLGSGQEHGGIWSLRGSFLSRKVRTDGDAFAQTATVSPDGTHYAYVDDGQLLVGELTRSGTTNVGGPGVEPAFAPQWTTDNAHVIVRYDGTKAGIIDIESAEIEPLAQAPEPYVSFSVDNGSHAVYGSPDRQEWSVVAVGPDAVPAPVIPVPFRHYSRFQSLAPDGRHAVALLRGFTEPWDDTTRTLAANAIVDLGTGTPQRLPGNATLRQGFFRADGLAVLRVSEGLADRVLLVSPDGAVADRVDLPPGVVDLSLLGYTPAPEPPPSSPPTQTPSPEPTEPPVVLDGTLFFLGGGLRTLHDGTLTQVVIQSGTAFAQTATVSPDGTRYAFIQNNRLRIAPLHGSPVAVGPATLDNSVTPVWSADGTSLIVRYGEDQSGSIDASSGVITPLPEESYVAVSPDGAYAVVGDPTWSIVHMADEPATVPVASIEDARIARVQSLSPDGHHAIVLVVPADATGPDVTRVLSANAIIDLTTGTSVPIPGGGTLREGYFSPDGSLVLRVTSDGVDQVVLVSRTGDVQDRLDLPAEVADVALLSYALAA